MWRSFGYKAARSVVVYGVTAFILILSALCCKKAVGYSDLSTFHKLVIWPFGFEFFIEMALAVEASWLVLNDMVSGTYKNAISSGIGRKKFFFSQITCVITLITLELLAATVYYFSGVMKGVPISSIGNDRWREYLLYMLFVWIHHMTIVMISMSLCFIARKLYMMLSVLLVLFCMMFFDALIKRRPELEFIVKILNHMPHAIARYLRDATVLESLTFGKAVTAIIPTLVIAIIMPIVAAVLFTKGDLNE